MLKTRCVRSPINQQGDRPPIFMTRARGRGLQNSRSDVDATPGTEQAISRGKGVHRGFDTLGSKASRNSCLRAMLACRAYPSS